MKYCMNCGKPVSETTKFCGECGADLTNTINAQPEAPETQPAFQSSPVIQQPVTQAQPSGLYTQPNVTVINQYAAKPEPRISRKNGLGVAGFILSLISLIISWIPIVGLFGLIPLIPAFLLSLIGFIVGLAKKKRFGLALAGVILSLLALGLMCGMNYVVAENMGTQYYF